MNDCFDTEAMFSRIAGRYDLFNRIAAPGLSRYWRKKAAKLACPGDVGRAIDLCCGTGDMAFALARTGKVRKITGIDASAAMIEYAKTKQSNRRVAASFEWICADACRTGLCGGGFELTACAFGLRNIPDRAAAVNEMYRLLTHGGRVCILEFSIPDNFFLGSLCLFYLRFAVPLIGRLLLGAGPADYLVRSIRNWDRTVVAGSLLSAAGFRDVRSQPLTGGVVSVHTGVKPPH